jgi:PAS domain-containing protein
MLKIDRRNLLKRSFTKFIRSEESDKFYLQRRKVLESGTKQTGELQMQQADGTPFYVQIESLKVGEERLRLAIMDISERKQVEEALKASEEKYRAIVETSMEGILIGAPDGRIVFANQRMADLLGYPLAEIIGKIGLEFMENDQKEV